MTSPDAPASEMTKREAFVMAAMQGMMCNGWLPSWAIRKYAYGGWVSDYSAESYAKAAEIMADAQIAALNEGEKG